MRVFLRDALHAYEREAFVTALAARGGAATSDRAQAEALVTGGATLGEDELASMPALRRVVRFARARADLDRERELLRARGIERIEVHGVSAAATAEHALAMLLVLLRRLPEYGAAMASGRWSHDLLDRAAIRDLSEVTTGVVGFGGVGRALVRSLANFGGTVLVARKSGSEAEIRAAGARPATLDEIVDAADAIVLAARSRETILTRERIARLRHDAVIVSVGSGGAVDLAALAEAVERGAVRAGLDVYPEEPADPALLPRDAQRAILTPHVAGRSRAVARALAERVADALVPAGVSAEARALVRARLRARRWSDFDAWDELLRRFERTALAGSRIFVAGYGEEERRVAHRARELGLLVTIVEPELAARLDAMLDGFSAVAARETDASDVVLVRAAEVSPVSEEEVDAMLARLVSR